MPCRVTIKSFNQLSNTELYYILQARVAVFTLERKGEHQDMDDKDFNALHVSIYKKKALAGYCRILPPKREEKAKVPKNYLSGQPETYPKIDKLLVLAEHRGYHLADHLIEQSVGYCQKQYTKQLIVTQAPVSLIPMYEPLGFQVASNPYSPNNIKCVDMVFGSAKNIKFKPSKSKTKKSSTLVTVIKLLAIVTLIMTIMGIVYLMR